MGIFNKKLNVIVFYDDLTCVTSTLIEHLESFSNYSLHNIYYAVGVRNTTCDPSFYMADVIIVHYSVRLSVKDLISPLLVELLSNFGGLKILFIQDEYEETETARQWIEKLDFNMVFTCVPGKFIHDIYPRERFKQTKFIQNLTGYVPQAVLKNNFSIPLAERKNFICYRGRKLPYWYGDLGVEKYEIGIKMKNFCHEHAMPCDIEWEEETRIYGDSWYHFLANSRTTLGTESGANIFDFYGEIRLNILKELERNPKYSYAEAKKQYLSEDGLIRMGQVSPKMLEAIACRTVLVLFEGGYSNILAPNRHYIPLKKDWSNIEDVIKKINDLNYLNCLAEVAYEEIIISGKYSYVSFIHLVEKEITNYNKMIRSQ
jgi:hypothetical protein